MTQQQDGLGALTPAVVHFQKVTASYWDGLFHCYQVQDLPRTNNDLEQFFGTARHVERRVDFPQASIAHSGCARLGARSGSGDQSTRFFFGCRLATHRCHGLACTASDARLSPRGPSQSTALPSRSTGLSCFIGTKSLQIRLAVLVFFRNHCTHTSLNGRYLKADLLILSLRKHFIPEMTNLAPHGLPIPAVTLRDSPRPHTSGAATFYPTAAPSSSQVQDSPEAQAAEVRTQRSEPCYRCGCTLSYQLERLVMC